MVTTMLANPRCADPDIDPEIFFSTDPATVTQAKQVCARCPERTACAQRAVLEMEEYGTFGGQSALERRPTILAVRARARAKVSA